MPESLPPPREPWRLRFRPALLDALRGQTSAQFGTDIVAGLVVGIIALPLAIAFAIASGADPRAGLVTAALAGFLVGALGGSRVQIAGPTGAFVVILYGIAAEFGFAKLLVATFVAGALLLLFGLLRLGTLIKFIPYPVTTGFTAGIAVIIFLGQLPHILGLRLNEVGVTVPADSVEKLVVIGAHLDRTGVWAIALALGTVLIIQGMKRVAPRIPGPAVALGLLTLLTIVYARIGVQTVGDLFAIPNGPPTARGLDLSWGTIREMFPSAITIALLGAIESLLSAVVADGMAGTKHDSNQELLGQGIANLVIPFFGGIAATGAIARTATNVSLGARTPVASIVHGLVVFIVLIAAGPYVTYIPMAVLAGILAVVSWNMSERHRFAQILKMPRSDAGVMLTTFVLTVFFDLTVAVSVGIVLAASLFIARMSALSRVNVVTPETDPLYQQHSLQGKTIPPGVLVYSIDGPFFFGAAEQFQEVLQRIGGEPKIVVFRMRRVPYLDATGLNALTTTVTQLRKHSIMVILSGVQIQPLDVMMRSGFTKLVGDENIQPNIDGALARAASSLGFETPARS